MIKTDRRDFLKKSILSSVAFTAPQFLNASELPQKDSLPISIFSKHLQFLNIPDMVEAAAEIGFDGVDLAVRPKGHVEPAQVGEQLPIAVDAFRKVGFTPQLMTCAVSDADDQTDRTVLETAAKLGFKYYRMNYYHYLKEKSIPDSLIFFKDKIRTLASYNEKLGITGCYQNHAGNYIGSSIWELYDLISATNSNSLGVQYDIRHAVVEGGQNWQNGLKLIHQRIKTLALKDFRWEKIDGKWKLVNCPIGEGMVDFLAFFKLIRSYQIHVPVSLHFEYPLGGADRGNATLDVNPKVVFNSMRRDLAKIRTLWEQSA